MTSSAVVLASLNIDVTSRVRALPRPGDTVLATAATRSLGGKGANQAVALARHGVVVHVVGAVGAEDGRFVLDALEGEGVDVSQVRVVADVKTGTAYVTVSEDGENSIVVHAGANSHVDHVGVAISTLLGSIRPRIGVAQGEVPADAVDAFAAALEQRSIRFVLNLAPVIDVRPRTIALADPLIVNESEAEQLAGAPAGTPIEAVLRSLQARARSVVITLGRRGSVASRDGRVWTQDPVVHGATRDTTGAGDAFAGSLCAALCAGTDLAEAVSHAADFAGRTVTRPGTTESYPRIRQGLR